MLELRGLSAGYGGTAVLRGIDLVVPQGCVVALLGANGAGKTTTLRAASGLLRPSAGRVVLDRHDVTSCSPHEYAARGLCHVPEGRGIFPNLTVEDNLFLHAPAGDEATATAKAITAFPILGTRLGQLAGTLSGGQQQMLALARAYMQDPKVVLLDEVSMGLAPKVVDEIFDFLRLLREGGASLLLVEQYVTRALEVADFVYLLSRGEVVFAGEPAELSSEDLFAQYVGASVGHGAT